jgi:hypothetical protein
MKNKKAKYALCLIRNLEQEEDIMFATSSNTNPHDTAIRNDTNSLKKRAV